MNNFVYRFLYMVFLTASMQILLACVGPVTPFGALSPNAKVQQPYSDDVQMRELAQVQRFKPQIFFHPKRQVLHGNSQFSIEVVDYTPIKEGAKLEVFYNNIDVTSEFLKNSSISKSDDGKRLNYKFSNLRLKSLETSQIRVKFSNHKLKTAEERYLPPQCFLFKNRNLASIDDFNPPGDYVDLIREVAAKSSYNPAFLAGIVAQESGFNPKAVSWAKAIGLTQITPIAEKEIIQGFGKWPRYPGINKLSYLKLKSKIILGEINPETEWRLNPKKSLLGGAAYLKYLYKYWSLDNNRKIIESLPGNLDHNLSEIILASYNSGAYRVKRAVLQLDKNWKNHEKLKEAIRYLNRVTSYCYHYSTTKDENGNET